MKMVGAPVMHVNGDHPEVRENTHAHTHTQTHTHTHTTTTHTTHTSQDMVRATEVAMDYWLTFHNDVAIDLVCFRRW